MKKVSVYFIIFLAILGLDYWTKWLVKTKMMLGESISVIGEFFRITSHRNRGAAFGILEDQRWFFIVATTVIVIAIIWYLRYTLRDGKKLLSFALTLVLAGAIGNFIDRVRSGEVVDFFHVYFSAFDYHYPIFNIADCSIVTGVALIALDTLLDWKKERNESKHEHA
ncbi:signal peptidase II [Marinicrinis lubricantis]|uniref:Lipoprotein signal peptidase n=1 Tax=Marinicrinis lubricantis TaxID=2086470 RepID=A0ABW1ISL0_9BACL